VDAPFSGGDDTLPVGCVSFYDSDRLLREEDPLDPYNSEEVVFEVDQVLRKTLFLCFVARVGEFDAVCGHQ